MSTVRQNNLLILVEGARRDEEYDQMGRCVDQLLNELGDDTSPEAMRLRSKITYERHMAKFQQAVSFQARADQAFQESLELALLSDKEARESGDEVGALFAEMNISGLLLPALGGWRKGVVRSEKTCDRAEFIAAAKGTSEVDRKRAWQVAMNTYFHRIRMIMTFGRGGKGAQFWVKRWLEHVKKNPIYLANQDKLRADVEAAEKFIRE